MSTIPKTTAVREVTTTAVATVRQAARPLIMADFLQQENHQRELLSQYIHQQMVEGSDFGVIPGTKNKTLLKPGAEKLTTLFRCIPRYVIEEKIENWETGLFFYRFSCQIITQADEAVVAEGVGSCSTYESRYRWRNADRVCPECGVAAIVRSKYPPRDRPNDPPGWYCFAKKNGCGANFSADDDSITGQKTGRIQNPDIIDAANTVLKMAKKRALVDASIALARCSDIFTQDVEDFEQSEPVSRSNSKPAPKSTTDIDGAEFERRLREADADMARNGLCPLGSLLAVVVQAGIRAGFGPDLTQWSQSGIELAVAETRSFKARMAEAAKAPAAKAPEDNPADDVEPTKEGYPEENQDNDPPETGNPVGSHVPAPEPKRLIILNRLHELNMGWRDAKAQERISVYIGRILPPGSTSEALTEAEADIVIGKLDEAVAAKAAKKAAADAKKAASGQMAEAAA